MKKSIDTKIILVGGVLWAAFICALNPKNDYMPNIQEGKIVFDGYVIDTPYYNRDSTIYQVSVQRYTQDEKLRVSSFNMQYIASVPFAEPIKNDLIRARCKIYIDEERIPTCISDHNSPPMVIERRGFGLSNSIIGYKQEISKFIYSHYKGSVGQVLIALSTGNSKGLLYETRRIFAISGTSHILAISGTHIGLIAIFLYYIVKILLLPISTIRPFSLKKASSLLLIPLLITVSFYFGNSPSVVRATIMIIVYLFSILIEKERDILSSLCVSFLLITSYNPDAIKDIGFQLSFLSVFGIITLIPSVMGKEAENGSIKKEMIRRLFLLSLTSLSASLFTLPAVAYHFGVFSVIGIISNILIVPFVGLITLPMILCGVIFWGLSQNIASFFFNGAFTSIEHLIQLNNLFSSIPFSHIKIFTPSVLEVFIYFAIIFTLILRNKIPFAKIIMASLIFTLIITSLIIDRIEKNRTEPSIIVRGGLVTFIDEELNPHIIVDSSATNRDKRSAVEFLRKKRMIKVYYSNLTQSDDLYIKDHLYTKVENNRIKKSEGNDLIINLLGFSVYIFNDIQNCPPTAARFVISRRSSEEAINKLYECGISPERLIFSGDLKNKRLTETLNKVYGDSASNILVCKNEDCEIILSPKY